MCSSDLMIKLKENLDTKICDFYNNEDGNTETFREFMIRSEKEFEIENKNLDKMGNVELNNYLDFLDELWLK